MYYKMDVFKSEEKYDCDNFDVHIEWKTSKGSGFSGGKLIRYLSDSKKIKIPDGIETIGKEAFVDGSFGFYNPPLEEVVIPASVKKIEEGAFLGTRIAEIKIAPGASCGIIKNQALFSCDGKTLLWILGNADEPYVVYEGRDEICVYKVPEGVDNIANDFCNNYDALIDVLELPASVIKIGELDQSFCDRFPVIRAPKGSNAIRIAKSRGWEYEEM